MAELGLQSQAGTVMAEGEADTPSKTQQKVTWVQCDDCSKWRRVPQAVADSLDDNSSWCCQDNPDKTRSSCKASQELSDDEIDRVLVSGGSHEVDNSPPLSKALRPAVWQRVTENIFTHRSRKVENEDDIMVCQCKPPLDGSPGCGDNCLNRMLNQECNPEYCPCGDKCSNTQFTRRQYAQLEKRRAGPKGFGLFTKQDLKAGQFVIEYVGEVLEEEEYLRRKLFYQDIGQRHYYFMNVGNGEVIDACRKGALGRFINHSCHPNCETQKWVVHGELAIGLFAIYDIQAGEELTFDYNFERYGDKALKCYCNAKACRGYIGGTPEEHEYDNEAEENMDASHDPEPIMIGEEEAASNPALAAILASEVGLAPSDYHDDRLRRGWEEMAAKHGLTLDWQSLGRGLALPAESAEESKAPNDAPPASTATMEAVEQKLKDTKAQRRLHGLGSTKLAASVPPKKRLVKDSDSATPGVAVSVTAADLSPVGAQTVRPKWQTQPQKGFRRRSEVDRRLDTLVAASGKLRDPGVNSIVRMLRLFNLCDVGTATASDAQPAKVEHSEASSRSAGGFTLSGEAGSGGTGPSDSTGRRSEQYREEGTERRAKRPRLDPELSPRSRSSARGGSSSSDQDREDGEIAEHPEPQVKPEPKARKQEVERPERAAEAAQLTARQRARMADLSLLLDVILKTSSSSTKKDFCKCGILRQLQSVLGRCAAQTYVVIVKKILRAIEHLPLTPEDLHQHSSAHGSFADTLWTLGGHSDHEIRNRARGLRDRYPLEACSREVQEAGRDARAAVAARKARHAGGAPPPFRSRRAWAGGEPRDSPYVPERLTRPGSGRARVSKFHGPNDTPAWEAPAKAEPWARRPRERPERESRWSYGPAPTPSRGAHEDPHPRRPQLQPSPLPMSFSTPLPSSAHQGHAQWGSKGLHRLHSTSGVENGHAGNGRQPAVEARNHRRQPRNCSPPQQPPVHAPATHELSFPQPHASAFGNIPPPPRPVYESVATSGKIQDVAMPETSPITPDHSPLPPLPTEPPPPVSPVGSPMSPGLPAASPVTPPDQAPGSPALPPMQTGAFMDDTASDDSHQGEALLAPKSVPGMLNGRSGDWKAPGWEVSQPGGTAQQSGTSLTLAAPHPFPGLPSTATTNGAAPHLPPPDSDGVPSIDGDAGSLSPGDGAQTWDKPDADFEEFVSKVIAHRLGKYKQPGHPNRIDRDDFKELYKKSLRQIIDAERKAFEERQRLHTFKHIERYKLEARIKDFVRELIRRLHERKASRI